MSTSTQEKNPWLALITIIAFSLAGLFAFQFLSIAVSIPFSGEGFQDLINKLSNPFSDPGYKWTLVFMQGMVSLGAFVIAPLFYIWRHEQKQFGRYFGLKNFQQVPAVITVFLVIAFMIVNSVFIEWNLNFQFPDFMSGFGAWAREKEDTLEQLTQYIITFDSVFYFAFVFLVVAILAGIGEELLFRGLIQRQIHRISGNVHVAIWVSAILFSAFHMQFFGFVPRLLLGAFFGYLYVFSGNLWYAILAHAVNNGLTLIMVYLYQSNVTDYDIESTESIPLISVGIFFIIGSILFYLFYKAVTPDSNLTNE